MAHSQDLLSWEALRERKRGRIIKIGDEALVNANHVLHSNMQNMLNNAAFSDVVFMCKDGKRVHGSRMVLAGTCEVLNKMLTNGMSESTLSEIDFPYLASHILLPIFEFLYTGTLSEYSLSSWTMALEIVTAARYFLLSDFEEIAWSYLASNSTFDPATKLNEAIELITFFDQDNYVILLDLVLSIQDQPAQFSMLSETALMYVLNTLSKIGNPATPSFTGEYGTFRRIVIWAMNQMTHNAKKAEEMVNLVVPHETLALSLLTNAIKPGGNRVDNARNQMLETLMGVGSLAGLLSMVDWTRVHPVLLSKVVEPLKILSSAELVEAYRFHAVERPLFRVSWPDCHWEHGESYTSRSPRPLRMPILQSNSRSTGFAFASVPMSRSFGSYEWLCMFACKCDELPQEDSCCELGILYSEDGLHPQQLPIDGQLLSDHQHSRVLKCTKDGLRFSRPSVDGDSEWQEFNWQVQPNKPGRFHFLLDMTKHACYITFGERENKKLGWEEKKLVWKDLPAAIYYPAASIKKRHAKVVLHLLSGFDLV